MLESFQLSLNKPSLTDDSAVPGYSACLSEPPSLRLPSAPRAEQALGFGRAERTR